MSNITFHIIKEMDEFSDIQAEWNSLLQRSAANTIFLTWEWMYTWWECFSKGKELLVIIIKDGSDIVGIAPLYMAASRFFGLRKLKHLEFLGTTGVITEYQDFIIRQGRSEELLPLIMDFIFDNLPQWDALNLVSMKQEATNLALIKEYIKLRGLEYLEYDSRKSPYIELPPTAEEFMQTLSKKSRWKFRDYRKKLESGRSVEVKETKDKNTVQEDFAVIMQMHQKRWERKGGPGSFAQSRVLFLKFHNTVIQRFFDNGWLFLLRLIVDGTPAVGHYSMFYNNTAYCHSVGFDPDWAPYNAGSVLQLYAVEESIKKGACEFDFLRGTEEYKYYWTKKERISVDTVIWRSKKIEQRVIFERKLRKIAKRMVPKTLYLNVYHRIVNRD